MSGPRILLLGAAGQLGHELRSRLKCPWLQHQLWAGTLLFGNVRFGSKAGLKT